MVSALLVEVCVYFPGECSGINLSSNTRHCYYPLFIAISSIVSILLCLSRLALALLQIVSLAYDLTVTMQQWVKSCTAQVYSCLRWLPERSMYLSCEKFEPDMLTTWTITGTTRLASGATTAQETHHPKLQ